MKIVSAYLLAVLGGNASPAEKDITAILKSVGVSEDAAKINDFLGKVKGKSVEEIIAQGRSKMSTVSVAAPAAPAKEEKKEEKKAEKKEEKKKEEKPKEEEKEEGFLIF